MAKINILFDGENYSIDKSAISSSTEALKTHLSTAMNGIGATINLDGATYNVDSTKLTNAINNFVSYLETISGSGSISNLIELGGTYTFKEDFSGVDIDWDKLRETALEQIGLGYILTFCYVDGKQGVIVYLPAEGSTTRQEILGIMTMDESYAVMYQFQSQDKPQTGWLNSIANEPIEPPTITLPTNESEVYVPLEALSIFFEGTGGSSGGIKITIGGIEYSVDSTKIEDAKSALAAHLKALEDASNDPTPYTVTLTTNNSEAGTVEFTSNGHSGTSASLTGEQTLTFKAVSNSGYQFVGWYVGETLISTDAIYTAGYTVSSETTIEARFEAYLAPGLYETGTKNMKMSWDELISSNILRSNGDVQYGKETELAGDLVIRTAYGSLGSKQFMNCTNLTGVTFAEGSGYTTIGKESFKGCTSLTSIEIPDSVTSIDYGAFNGCTNLTSVAFGESSKLTHIDGYVFYGCKKLTACKIPDGVTSIGSYAFSGCSGLTSIEIPGGVTTIGANAFSRCTSLTSIEIPEGVTSIDGTFSDCSGLTSISIPDSVTSIDGTFQNCSGLTSVTIPDSVTSIGNWAFYGCASLTSIEIPEGVTTIGDRAFQNCSGLTSIDVPANVTSIGGYAFSGCSGLTSIDIPDGVTTIGSEAFSGCSGLTSIDIPDNVTYIYPETFKDCTSLTSIEIPDGITSIGKYAFDGCTGLTSIDVPANVTSIGKYAFSGCSGLTSITIHAETVATKDNIFGGGCNNLTVIYVPADLVDDYKGVFQLTNFASKVQAIQQENN